MEPDCCRPDYDAVFGEAAARRELAAYRRRGAAGTTRRLVEALAREGVDGASVLDIGGGVGVIGAELLGRGAATVTDVDASRAYLDAARSEMSRRGFAERAGFHLGDFVVLAPAIAPADIVTLDRVICCYADWQGLVDASTRRARRLYGLAYPCERWWMRLIVGGGNLMLRLFRQSFRFYLHPEREVDARVRGAGFEPRFSRRGLLWQTVVYARAEVRTPSAPGAE